ncbi:hypothetical protein PPYR_07347 [Photinus pyralis]|uniref:Lipase n=1 Tax=Photinus pyralis TaxID=7054 RepID=A0A1Y1KS37_PHOPY|nr:lipase member J-like [Photinus pyralis]KAB0799467.1 hypothetical protein PPYR_07347 [Photinus pyralis]
MKRITILSVFIALISLLLIPRSKNNVCKSFSDYYGDRDKNENCYYNPDTYMNVSQIIKQRGYPVEEHDVTTKDGYILTLFRIPLGKNSSTLLSGRPILILHGVLTNSASFVNRGNKSLAFLLADAGYDVWLGNFRGTVYGKKHTQLKNTDRLFWEFNTYELGVYDIAAKIDHIYSITKQKITYLGFSFGSTAGYMYSVTNPSLAEEKIRIIISLAPTVFLSNWKSITKYFIQFWPYTEPFFTFFTNGEVALRGTYQSKLREMLCLPYPFQMYLCQLMDMIAMGFDYEQNDPETLPVTLLQNSDATSYKTISHGLQLVSKGNFDYLDYGSEELNMAAYGSPEVPKHNLSRLSVPTYLVTAINDMMITVEDVKLLHEHLPKKVNPYDLYIVKHEAFNHDDFIAARDVVPLVYNPLVNFINNLS